jgi:hypothetical protein
VVSRTYPPSLVRATLLGATSLRGVWSAVTHTHDEPGAAVAASLEPCKDGRVQFREATRFNVSSGCEHGATVGTRGLCSRRSGLARRRVAVHAPARRLCSGRSRVSSRYSTMVRWRRMRAHRKLEIGAAAYGSFVTRLPVLLGERDTV